MDMEAIRRGLAANLRTVPDCQVSPYLLDNPTGPSLQVAGFDEIDYLQDFGPGQTVRILVEGCAGMAESRAAYTRFDKWLIRGTQAAPLEDSVADAIEADRQLTSRWRDNGTVLASQTAACQDLQVTQFRGYRAARTANGTELLVGNWAVEIIT